jgi:hypothetical protein
MYVLTSQGQIVDVDRPNDSAIQLSSAPARFGWLARTEARLSFSAQTPSGLRDRIGKIGDAWAEAADDEMMFAWPHDYSPSDFS